MARTFAMTRVAIWGDDDFLDLSPVAQWLYWRLYSHPDLSYCGAVDWRPKKLVPSARGMTLELLESAATELSEARYVVIDEATEEALVRSFMRNDELLRQKNMGAAVAKAYAAMASRELRGVVVWELIRLNKENPKWTSWKALSEVLEYRSVDPFAEPNDEPNPNGDW